MCIVVIYIVGTNDFGFWCGLVSESQAASQSDGVLSERAASGLMRLHNGTFDIANAPGGGTVVTMTLSMEK